MDQVSKVKRPFRSEEWKKRIAECQSSGMTVKANGLNAYTYLKYLLLYMPAKRLWHSLIWAAYSRRRKSAATIDVSELIDLPPYGCIKS